jgi:hypothetical protein
VVVRITATPQNPAEGARLASEILAAVQNGHRGRDGTDAET